MCRRIEGFAGALKELSIGGQHLLSLENFYSVVKMYFEHTVALSDEIKVQDRSVWVTVVYLGFF